MTPEYQSVSFDLATPRTNAPIVPNGTKINHVAVEGVPAGAGARLHFGDNKDGVPLIAGESWDCWADGPDGCPVAINEGLFLTNPAGAGLLELVISFGEVGVAR